MFGIVILIFIVCWAPYHIYYIYSYHNPSITRKAYIGHVYLFFYWLAMSNTCVNPIIYYWMNARFRAYFKQILCCVALDSLETGESSRKGFLAKTKKSSYCDNALTVDPPESMRRAKCKCHEKSLKWKENKDTSTDNATILTESLKSEISITVFTEVLI